MEAFQPILIVLLAALVAVWLALAGRMIADRRRRRRIDALLRVAEPRMRSRLMAIGDPSIPPGLEIPGTVGAPEARPAASQSGAASTGRPALRNAAAGLAAMAILAGVLGLAVPNATLAPTTTPGPMEAAARPTEASARAPAPSPTPVPTRVAVSPPSEAPMPSPTLVVTGSDPPPPTAAPAGQDREPTASISCTFGGALTVSVRGRSTRARWAHWHFGDGTTVIGTHVSPHTYPSAGRYLIRFTVSNAHGSRTARQWVDLVARTGCS